ncbi:MAG: hypothetical protein RIQ94_1841, partial [Pseudomonadota bacterium]
STHTNYFDQIFKERRGKPPVELDNYTEPIQLVKFYFVPSVSKQVT